MQQNCIATVFVKGLGQILGTCLHNEMTECIDGKHNQQTVHGWQPSDTKFIMNQHKTVVPLLKDTLAKGHVNSLIRTELFGSKYYG